MGKHRDTYKYLFKIGNRIVHGGITDDLERREVKHQQKWPKGHIVQVSHRTTEEAARKWERDKGFSRGVKSAPVTVSRKALEYKKAVSATAVTKKTTTK